MYKINYLSIKATLFIFVLALVNNQLISSITGQEYQAPDVKSSLEKCQTSIGIDPGSTTRNSSSKTKLVSTSYVTEYNLPNGTWPNAILADKNGTIWTVGTSSHTLINFDPKQARIISSYPIRDLNYDLTGSINTSRGNKPSMDVRMAWAIIEANDGSIWFSLSGQPPLWLFDPLTKTMRHFDSVKTAPFQMKVDKDTGNIWYTTFQAGKVGVIQLINEKSDKKQTIYEVSEFDLEKNVDSSGLFIEGKSLWITESLANKVIKFNIITDAYGRVTGITKGLEIPSSNSTEARMFYIPADVVVQSDKNKGNTLWLTEHGASFITRYETSSGNVTRFPTSEKFPNSTTLPFWIRVGLDNNSLWFNEHIGNRIAFLNSSDMTLTEYEIPTRNPLRGYIANALNLAVDPNNKNKVWFSEFNNDKIGGVSRNMPIWFKLQSLNDSVWLSSDMPRQVVSVPIDIEINRNAIGDCSKNLIQKNNSSLSLKASSSMTPTGNFVNITATFSNMTIFNPVPNLIHTTLVLTKFSAVPSGEYTIAVSATDETVTRSIFLNLIVG